MQPKEILRLNFAKKTSQKASPLAAAQETIAFKLGHLVAQRQIDAIGEFLDLLHNAQLITQDTRKEIDGILFPSTQKN